MFAPIRPHVCVCGLNVRSNPLQSACVRPCMQRRHVQASEPRCDAVINQLISALSGAGHCSPQGGVICMDMCGNQKHKDQSCARWNPVRKTEKWMAPRGGRNHKKAVEREKFWVYSEHFWRSSRGGFVESSEITPVFRLLNYKPGLLWRYERQGGSEAVQYGRCIQGFFGGM